MNEITIVITPRDRYSGIDDCLLNLYEYTEYEFNLIILDLGYPDYILRKVKNIISNKKNAKIIKYGLVEAMIAIDKVRHSIDTKYTVLLDNDSRVTKGWLEPLISTVKEDIVIVSPLILEKEGVDDGATLRNHLHTCDIRVLDYNGQKYLIEDKKYRRALPKTLPSEIQLTDTFELHCVLFLTEHLHKIEVPHMVVREHIDIGFQTRVMGKTIVVQPCSVVIFDNLGTKMNLSDMKFFFFRWSRRLSEKSHRLFERRWGYKFYSENAMYVWAFRRKVFLLARYIGFPIKISNKITGLMKRIFCKDWDPLDNPIQSSSILRENKDREVVMQLDHTIRL